MSSVPPLRERVADIPALIEHFLRKAHERHSVVGTRRLAPDVCAALARCPWPGNVRELENVVTRLVVVCAEEVIEMADLEAHVPQVLAPASPLEHAKLRPTTLRQLEANYIAWTIAQCGGNKKRAVQLGELVVAAFDEAAQLSSDPREVSRLATLAVARMLRHARRADTSLLPPAARTTASAAWRWPLMAIEPEPLRPPARNSGAGLGPIK